MIQKLAHFKVWHTLLASLVATFSISQSGGSKVKCNEPLVLFTFELLHIVNQGSLELYSPPFDFILLNLVLRHICYLKHEACILKEARNGIHLAIELLNVLALQQIFLHDMKNC